MIASQQLERVSVPPARPSIASASAVLRALRRMRLAAIGLLVLLLAVISALLAPWLAPHDPAAVSLSLRLQPPLTPGCVLGTDALGQEC